MKAYMMIGVPGSGKSTYAKKLIEIMEYINKNCKYIDKNCNIVYISRDEIRFSLLKEGDAYFSKENQVYKIFTDKIRENLKAGNDVIIDATHMTWGSRHKVFKNLAGIDGVEVYGIWMRTSFMECAKRNQAREGKYRVPDNQFKNMVDNFEEPELDEGFKNIQEIW